jgi:adenosylcobinamide-GDP ribazoletransferase
MQAARALLAAISFLTRVPVGRLVDVDGRAVGRAAPLYPLVGAGIGAAGGAVAAWRPGLAGAALGVALVALLTGAMHLDALADTADALGGATRERRLEIMRDHTIGSFGATALALALIVKIAVLAELDDPLLGYLVAAACARWAGLPLAAALPYARAEGQALALTAATTWPATLLGLAAAAAIALLALGLSGLAALGTTLAVALLLGGFYRRWLGGVTGDTLGAATEVAEVAALAALLWSL